MIRSPLARLVGTFTLGAVALFGQPAPAAVYTPATGSTVNLGTLNGAALASSQNAAEHADLTSILTAAQASNLCFVTTAPPSYTAGTTNNQSCNLTGGLRVDGSGVTQPVSGTVSVSGTVPVSGTVTVVGAYQATQPISIAASVPVTGAFYQATQPVSIAASVPVTIATMPSTPVTNIGTFAVQTTGTVQQVVGTSGGATHFRTLPPATPTPYSVKGSAGQLYQLWGFNSSASPAFVKIYDAVLASVTCGSGTPVETDMLPANSGFTIPTSVGDVFGTGITICVTGGIADTDATVITASTLVVNGLYK